MMGRRNRPLIINGGKPGGGGPPVDAWRSFNMLAGTSINWIGYVSDAFELANPAGSISREPNRAHVLVMLVYDPNLDAVIASFVGDCTAALGDFSLFVNGEEIRFDEIAYDDVANETGGKYPVIASPFVDGQSYVVDFKIATIPPVILNFTQPGNIIEPGDIENQPSWITTNSFLLTFPDESTVVMGWTGTRWELVEGEFPTVDGNATLSQNGEGAAVQYVNAALPIPVTAPAQISIVTASPGDSIVELTWTAPDDGGSPITDYVVEFKLDTEPTIWTPFVDGASPTPGAVVNGLTNGAGYVFHSAAVNAIGQGPWSDEVSATPTPTAANVYNPTAKQFEITNAAAFPGAVYVWKDELGNVIAGQTASVMPESAQPDGLYVWAIPDGIADAASNKAISAVVLSGFVDEINAPDGTRFDDTATTGWTSFILWSGAAQASDAVDIQSGRLHQTKTRSDTSLAWKRFGIPTGDKIVTFENAFEPTAGADQHARYSRYFYVEKDATDTDYVLIYTGSAHLKLDKRVAGVTSTIEIAADNLNVFAGKTKLSTKRVGDRLRVYADNVEIPRSVTLGGFDITGAKKTAGIAWYPGDNQGVWNYPVNHFDRMTVTGVLAKEFNVVTKTIGEPDATYPAGSFSLVGTCTPGITNYDWSISAADGSMLVDWTSNVAVTSDGNWSILTPLDPKVAGTFGSLLRLRVSGTPGLMTTYDLGSIAAYAPILPSFLAMNSAGVATYSNADIVKDRGRIASWRYSHKPGEPQPHSYVPANMFNAEGWPIGPLPDYADAITALLFEGTPPGTRFRDAASGGWVVTVNAPSSVIETRSLINCTVTNKTATSLVINQLDPAASTTTWISFKDVVIPSEGLQLTCLPANDTSSPSELMTPEVAALWVAAGVKSWRNMKDTGAELAGVLNYGYAGKVEFAVSITHQGIKDIYWTVPYLHIANERDTTVRAYLEYFRDHASAGSTMSVEVGNEPWNFGTYSAQHAFMAAGAAGRGFISGVVIPEGVVATNEAYDAKFNPAGGVGIATGTSTAKTLRVFQPGEYFFCAANNYQHTIIKVISPTPVPIDTTVPFVSDANFEVLALFDNIQTGVRREQSYQQIRVGTLGKEILGDRFTSVLGAWLNDSDTKLSEYILFNDAWKWIDHWSITYYSGSKVDYANLSWASQYSSNFSAFETGYYNKFNAGITATVTKVKNLKHSVFTKLLQAGVPYDQCPTQGHYYEGGDHNTIGAVPEGDRAGVVAAVTQCLKSDAEETAFASLYQQLVDKVGGKFYQFADVATPIWNNGETQVQCFGLRQYQFDSALNNNGADERRYLGVMSVFGGGA